MTDREDASTETADAGPGEDVDASAAMDDAGPGDAGPRAGYGEACRDPSDCASGLCLVPAEGGPGTCSRECDLARANACRAERALCLPLDRTAVCYGSIPATGPDVDDDARVTLGDCVTRSLSPLGTDVDLFQIRASLTGPLLVTMQPESGVDLRVEFYDGAGALIAVSNMNGPGGLEGLRFERWAPENIVYAVVQDAGSTIANPYRVCVEAAPAP